MSDDLVQFARLGVAVDAVRQLLAVRPRRVGFGRRLDDPGRSQRGVELRTMNGQLSLDDLPRPVARHSDPGTSWQAARMAEPAAGTNRALALRVLRQHPGGLTDFELAAITGLQQTSIGKRRGELRDAGLVRATGWTRLSPSGAAAIVWEAVP